MSTVDQLKQRIVESQLITAEAADSHVADWRSETGAGDGAPGEQFVSWLIQRGHITQFQGEAIEAGHTGPFMLGPYRVLEQIAAGTLGSVFRAEHEEFNQPVSLKVFPSNLKDKPEKLARMGREVRILAELDHPNVVRSFQVGNVGDTFYVALEELSGESLASRLERETRLPFEEACRIARDVARGLAHLHDNEVIHRDLRPATIWLTDTGVPKVREFGAARDAYDVADEVEEGMTLALSEDEVGDYAYMPTEQAVDPVNANERSDIYALGCMLYHCLAGHPPFVERNPVRLALQHALFEPPKVGQLMEGVPAPIDETLTGMLAKNPNQRFENARQVAFALDQYVPEEAEGESVAVVQVSDQYLEWVRAQHPTETRHVAESAAGISPELAHFLDWTSRRRPRRR